jgi:methyl-accepting chemotaxis protein
VAALDKLVAFQLQLMKDSGAQAEQTARNSGILMIALGVAGAGLGLFAGWYVTGTIVRPIRYAVRVARTVADGDLSSEIQIRTRDEIGQLSAALKDMNTSLISIVSEVRKGTDSIGTASQEIAAGNLDLSERTERQAGSLEETASSMEELTSTVKQNAANASQANQLARRLPTWPAKAAKWWRRWSTPWRRSTPPRARLSTSFRSSTVSLSRPISWR